MTLSHWYTHTHYFIQTRLHIIPIKLFPNRKQNETIQLTTKLQRLRKRGKKKQTINKEKASESETDNKTNKRRVCVDPQDGICSSTGSLMAAVSAASSFFSIFQVFISFLRFQGFNFCISFT